MNQVPAERITRRRNRAKTQEALELALHRLQKQGAKVSIRAVAVEAGVTPALIGNKYLDFAEKLRGITGKELRRVRDEKHQLLQQERDKVRELRAQIESQRQEIVKLASINETMKHQITVLHGIVDGKVAQFPRKS